MTNKPSSSLLKSTNIFWFPFVFWEHKEPESGLLWGRVKPSLCVRQNADCKLFQHLSCSSVSSLDWQIEIYCLLCNCGSCGAVIHTLSLWETLIRDVYRTDTPQLLSLGKLMFKTFAFFFLFFFFLKPGRFVGDPTLLALATPVGFHCVCVLHTHMYILYMYT